MSAPKILIAESNGFAPEALRILADAGTVISADLGYEDLCQAVSDVDVLWVRLRNRIDAALIASAAHLKVVVTATTGLNHLDTRSLAEHGIQLLSLKGEVEFLRNVRATAEHTIGLMLSLLRHLPEAIEDTRTGNWSRDNFEGNELYGRTVGVIGYGRLGTLVSRYLAAFEANVLVCDPRLPASFRQENVRGASLEYLLTHSDIVTLHADLNDGNAGFLTGELIQKMKTSGYFINTSRGELIDESALLRALKAGKIRGAALDVLSGESAGGMTSHPLVQYASEHSNLILTPHLGGCTTESKSKTEVFLATKLRDLLASLNTENDRIITSSVI